MSDEGKKRKKYLGTEHFGNFSAVNYHDYIDDDKFKIEDIDDGKFHLCKVKGTLLLCKDNKECELVPEDYDAECIVELFSDRSKYNNESLYDVKKNNDQYTVTLYTNRLCDLSKDNRKFKIFLESIDETHFLKQNEKDINSYINGIYEGEEQYSDIRKYIPAYLNHIFIENHSIFLDRPAENEVGDYTLFGDSKRLNVRMKKPGLYCILPNTFKKIDEPAYNQVQVYGDVGFITEKESFHVDGNNGTDEILDAEELFRTWDAYVDFKDSLYRDELPKHILLYKQVELTEEDITFRLSNTIKDCRVISQKEWEFIPSSKYPADIKELKDPITILNLKNGNKEVSYYLNKPIRTDPDCIVFSMPINLPFEFVSGTHGTIIISDKSLRNESTRRKRIEETVRSGNSIAANHVLYMSRPDFCDMTRMENKPCINPVVKECMFGTDDVCLNPDYIKAMDMAFNNKDLVLIQGPPGTGKTTLIKGLIASLKEKDKTIRILVSSEQHAALHNAIDMVSETDSMPPLIAAHNNYNCSENSDFSIVLNNFHKKCIEACESALNKAGAAEGYSKHLAAYKNIIREIYLSGYSKKELQDHCQELFDVLIKLEVPTSTLTYFTETTNRLFAEGQVNNNPLTSSILASIDEQCTDPDNFSIESVVKAMELQDKVRCLKNDTLVLEDSIMDSLMSPEHERVSSALSEYSAYLHDLKSKLSEGDVGPYSAEIEELIKRIDDGIDSDFNKRKADKYCVVEAFRNLIDSPMALSGIVKSYSKVIGCTNNQVSNKNPITYLGPGSVDYVIIDEAARANPVDVIGPIIAGKRVLMIGDQKQLPHFLEDFLASRFEKDPNYQNEGLNVDLLRQSLFETLYANLELASNEERLASPRTIMLSEQHRMHPEIARFISEEFYEGKLRNGVETKDYVNDYGIFNGKNTVFINVMKGRHSEETHMDVAIYRDAEVHKIMDIIKELVSLNSENKGSDRDLDIGIISYYNGQVDRINEELEAGFTEDYRRIIQCGTVDSFQGKEFDIVIVSCVRSNNYNRIGFLKNSESRINVSLSRARRLLIVLGDMDTVSECKPLHDYISYVKENGYFEEWIYDAN